MAICVAQTLAATWEAAANPLPTLDGACAAGVAVVVTLSEYQEYMLIKNGSIGGITTADALYAFTWGFGVVTMFWAWGYFFGTSKHAIKSI